MKKRMVMMLAGAGVFIALIAAVKTRQIQAGMKAHAAFQPPPEAVTTDRGESGAVAGDLNAIGTVAAVQGVTVSADLPGIVDKIAFESGQMVRPARCWCSSTREQEEAQLAAAEAQRELAGLNLDRARRAWSSRASWPRPTYDRLGSRVQAGGGAGRRDPRHHRAQDDPRAVRGRPRHPPGQPRPVPARRATRSCRCSRSTRSTSTSPCRSRSSAAAAASACAVRVDGRRGASDVVAGRQGHRDRLGRRRGDAQRPGPGDVRQPGRQAAPGHVRRDERRHARRERARSSRSRPRPSATRPTATRSSSSRTSRTRSGKTYRGVRQQFVKLGAARGDQVAVARRASSRARRSSRSGVFKLRNGAAVAVNNEVAARQQPGAEAGGQLNMKLHRPLHPAAGPRARRQPGHPDRRAAGDPLALVRQYPRSDIAVVTVTTVYVGANADLVRGFITTPLERVIASADGIDYIESQSAQGLSTITVRLKLNYDTNARARRDQRQGGPGAQRPAARGRGAGHQHRDGRHAVRRDVPRVSPRTILEQNQITDYLIARRPAAALGHRRRAARRHPRRPHLRHAHLAQARPHGGARASARRRCATRWPPTTTSPPSGQTKGSLVSGQPHRQHRPADRSRSSGSSSSASRTASSSASATIADVVLGAEDYDTEVRFTGQTARLHGHLGAARRQLARRHQARARGDDGDPARAARRA